ncbi:hypothetical protein [Saccharothrix coeruleofusca]|uniref:hypothetical protein n=1 Tax=Saccharothrix coeruleofusca TaxID=33919 RepID=UPI0016714A79|nr:hypothetical protein [Saccharothrix coeruleofusca]MBP2340036.1 hypothetical protein [Saccharothrix coeruleofusca]
MTFSQEPDQSQPRNDFPTVRIAPVAVPSAQPAPTTPAAAAPAKPVKKRSTLRRIARRIVGPGLLTKKG